MFVDPGVQNAKLAELQLPNVPELIDGFAPAGETIVQQPGAVVWQLLLVVENVTPASELLSVLTKSPTHTV